LPDGKYAYSGQATELYYTAQQCQGGDKSTPAVNALDFNLDGSKFQTIDVGPGRLQSPAAGAEGPVYTTFD
jgi:hypothetical protein